MAKRVERGVFALLRLATYTIVAAAACLFIDITVKGIGSVTKSEAPYIEFSFFTEAPETLHVFEPKEVVRRMERLNSEQVALAQERERLGDGAEERRAEIAARLRSIGRELDALDAKRRQQRKMYGDGEYRDLKEPPSTEQYLHNTYSYSGGGIGPAIVGTVLLVVGSIAIALVLGVLSAIYLSEYSRPGKLLQLIRLSILNLSGVPSIVFGLFGYGMFVLFFGWGKSMIAGWFTLALMALPVIIAASEEAMRSIPKGFREGALALGASKWTAVRTNVLPYALPGILTSSIMGIARVAGETAPIMFTAAFNQRDRLPWEGLEQPHEMVFSGVMALPYHIYVVSSKIPQNEYTRDMQYGTAFVFLLIVGSLALTSILLRSRLRNRADW